MTGLLEELFLLIVVERELLWPQFNMEQFGKCLLDIQVEISSRNIDTRSGVPIGVVVHGW